MNSQNNIIDVFVPVDTENVFKLLGKSFKIDESVKEYKGFYIARYEAGIDGASKRNQKVIERVDNLEQNV